MKSQDLTTLEQEIFDELDNAFLAKSTSLTSGEYEVIKSVIDGLKEFLKSVITRVQQKTREEVIEEVSKEWLEVFAATDNYIDLNTQFDKRLSELEKRDSNGSGGENGE